MNVKKLLILFITGIFIVGCSNKSSGSLDGWYHVQKGEVDSIIGEAIVTVDDFTALKLDSFLMDSTMYYTINGKVNPEKAKRYLDATERLIGKQMGFVYKGRIICAPSPNMRLDSPTFSIGSWDRECILEIYESIKHLGLSDGTPVSYEINGIKFTPEEYVAIEASRDSFMTAEDRWRWPDSIKSIFLLPDSIRNSEVPRDDSDWDIAKYWTPEQKEMAMAIYRIYLKNMKLEGTTIVLSISREEFRKTGIPEVYYDEMLESTKVLNFHNKIYKRSNRDIVFEWSEGRSEFRKMLEEYSAEKDSI